VVNNITEGDSNVSFCIVYHCHMLCLHYGCAKTVDVYFL